MESDMVKRIGEIAAAATEATQAFETASEAGLSAGLEKTQAEVKANMDKTIKTAEELVAFGQGNLEAWVQASQIWAAGVQDLSRTVAATAQAQLDETMATVKALAGVKSLKEAVDLQTTLARASAEKVVTEAGKLTDASLKLAEQAWAPLTARASLAAEKFGHAAA
jgi:phasin family protein